MKTFTRLYEELDATTSTLEKVAAIKRYLSQVSPHDAMWMVLILTGRLEKKKVTSRDLRQAFLQGTQYPEWLFEESYSQVGDTAETISLLLQSLDLAKPERAGLVGSSVEPEVHLWEWMETEIPRLGSLKDSAEQAQLLMQYWQRSTPTEIFILNKLMTGAFRVGVSEKLVIRALSENYNIPSDQIAHRLTGRLRSGAQAFQDLVSQEVSEVPVSQAYPFCLAHAWTERSAVDFKSEDWQVEWKYDGIRAQVIRRDSQVWIWSRGEDEITTSFPDLLAPFMELPEGTVLDGEILIRRDGRIQAFQDLQKRLGRKKVPAKTLKDYPAVFMAYDLLESKGQDLRSRSLRERRRGLEALMGGIADERLFLSSLLQVTGLQDLEELRSSSRGHQAEGLMIKSIKSPYSVGRKTGVWWKHKVEPLTLDAVLLYAQAGTGRRANLYTDYTFALWSEVEGPERQLVPFAKAYSGLDQAEIDELDAWIRRHTKEKFGPVRSLEAAQVFEIAFEGIAPSTRHKSGIAVRFPRILRWRKDKAVQDADSLENAKRLLHLSAISSAGVSA